MPDHATDEAKAEEDQIEKLNAPATKDNAKTAIWSLPKPKDVSPDKSGLYHLWEVMVYTKSVETFDSAWQMMADLFPD